MFTDEDVRKIATAIQAAELKTSGEIRVRIEPRLTGDAYERAIAVFRQLKMDRTRERNGVLILFAPKCRSFAIVGDIGIHEKVGLEFWNSTRDLMQSHFKEGRFPEGLIDGIQKVGESLSTLFPNRPGDVNELPDEVSR